MLGSYRSTSTSSTKKLVFPSRPRLDSSSSIATATTPSSSNPSILRPPSPTPGQTPTIPSGDYLRPGSPDSVYSLENGGDAIYRGSRAFDLSEPVTESSDSEALPTRARTSHVWDPVSIEKRNRLVNLLAQTAEAMSVDDDGEASGELSAESDDAPLALAGSRGHDSVASRRGLRLQLDDRSKPEPISELEGSGAQRTSYQAKAEAQDAGRARSKMLERRRRTICELIETERSYASGRLAFTFRCTYR